MFVWLSPQAFPLVHPQLSKRIQLGRPSPPSAAFFTLHLPPSTLHHPSTPQEGLLSVVECERGLARGGAALQPTVAHRENGRLVAGGEFPHAGRTAGRGRGFRTRRAHPGFGIVDPPALE